MSQAPMHICCPGNWQLSCQAARWRSICCRCPLQSSVKSVMVVNIVDLGLRRHLLPCKQYDIGLSLENVVYFELLRREYQVNVGKVGNVHEYKESVPHPILDTERILFCKQQYFRCSVQPFIGQKQSGLPMLVKPCKPVSTTLFCELAQ